MALIRFALFLLRGLRPPRYGRHSCADHWTDMTDPPGCWMCGRTP